MVWHHAVVKQQVPLAIKVPQGRDNGVRDFGENQINDWRAFQTEAEEVRSAEVFVVWKAAPGYLEATDVVLVVAHSLVCGFEDEPAYALLVCGFEDEPAYAPSASRAMNPGRSPCSRSPVRSKCTGVMEM